MANYRKYSLYRATNHDTGEVKEYIAYPTWAFDYGFDVVNDPEGFDTDIELLEKDGWIYVQGELKSGWPFADYIRLADLEEFRKDMQWIKVKEVVK